MGSGGMGSGGMGSGGMGGGAGTGGAPPSGFHVLYKAANTKANDIQMQPHFKIVNDTQNNVPFTDLTLRYWFTGDGGVDFIFDCDFAQFNCIYTKGTFSATTGTKADMYVEISFLSGSGTLIASTDSGEIQGRIHTQNFTTVNQPGDYSFDPTKTDFTDWANVTLYNKGVLVWGVEP